jgi:hypothetical protein
VGLVYIGMSKETLLEQASNVPGDQNRSRAFGVPGIILATPASWADESVVVRCFPCSRFSSRVLHIILPPSSLHGWLMDPFEANSTKSCVSGGTFALTIPERPQFPNNERGHPQDDTPSDGLGWGSVSCEFQERYDLDARIGRATHEEKKTHGAKDSSVKAVFWSRMLPATNSRMQSGRSFYIRLSTWAPCMNWTCTVKSLHASSNRSTCVFLNPGHCANLLQIWIPPVSSHSFMEKFPIRAGFAL